MSLEHFPGLCSSTDSPVHLCGFYNNVLLLFCVNICYCAGSAFFLPPTFILVCALPEKCGLTETIPRDIAMYSSVTAIICQAMSMGLAGRQHMGAALCVPGGPCSPSPAGPLASPERAMPHLGAWVSYGWRFFGLGHEFRISELCFCPSAGLDKSGSLLAPDYHQHRGMACKCLWAKELTLGIQASRSRSG